MSRLSDAAGDVPAALSDHAGSRATSSCGGTKDEENSESSEPLSSCPGRHLGTARMSMGAEVPCTIRIY